MDEAASPPLTVVRPGEGRVEDLGDGVGVAFNGFRSGEREVVLGPGGYITEPRGELHAMWNSGPVPARMIEIISPAGFELFFRDIAELAATGTAEVPDYVALAESYGLQFGDPE